MEFRPRIQKEIQITKKNIERQQVKRKLIRLTIGNKPLCHSSNKPRSAELISASEMNEEIYQIKGYCISCKKTVYIWTFTKKEFDKEKDKIRKCAKCDTTLKIEKIIELEDEKDESKT